jgi:fatty acid desaturase
VLWGVAFYVAIGLETWTHGAWVWPVTMAAAVVVMVIVFSQKADAAHDAEIKRQIVNGIQRSRERFAGVHQVAQVGA